MQRTGTSNPFNGVDAGVSSTPSFADLDGDGDLDAFTGDIYGHVVFFEHITLYPLLNLPAVVR